MFTASPATRRRCLANCSKLPSHTRSQLTRTPAKPSQWHPRNSLSTSAHLSSEQPSSAPSLKNEKQIIFSGIQPTGIPHLGNYLGALREWVLLQNSTKPDTTTLLYSIVDLHALTLPQDPEVLRTWRRQSFATLLAVGLDPARCRIFHQSAVSEHAELMWILSTVSSMGYLSRMTQWKSKLQLPENSNLEDQNARAKLKLGLFSYPVLMAADVLVHGATHIPVGDDQKQHIEFAREVANGFNYIYGPVLTMPEPLISPAKRIMSLKSPTQKMSKSHTDPRSRILLTDTPNEIRAKIKGALTDSTSPNITYDPVNRPGVSNLVEILRHVGYAPGGQVSFEEVAREYEGVGLKAFKEVVGEKLVRHLEPVRERYAELMGSERGVADLEEIAREGAEGARRNAREVMGRVKEAVGIL